MFYLYNSFVFVYQYWLQSDFHDKIHPTTTEIFFFVVIKESVTHKQNGRQKTVRWIVKPNLKFPL